MKGNNYIIRARYKRRNRFGRVLFLLILIGILFWCAFAASDVYGWMGSMELKMVDIPEGSNITQVSQLLKQEQIISHPFVFRTLARFSGDIQSIKMGSHPLRSDMSYSEIIKVLSKTPQEAGIKVTIPEGFESYKIAETLSEKGLVDKNSFLKKLDNHSFDYPFLDGIKRSVNRLEGYLFPATYTFKEGTSEEEIIRSFLSKFNDEFDASMQNRARELGMTIDEIVTLASIIEREAKNNEEMPIISSIFHNRLKKNSAYPYLQSCATIQYLLKERKPVISIEDTKINSPYNTYIFKGLPPGPIANPGRTALIAALYPGNTDYYFFVLNKDGTKHIYSKTFAEHDRAVRENQ